MKDHIAQLHKQWDTNDDKFRAARAFIYEVFPTFQDSAAVEKGLPEAERAFDECRRVDNVVAAQKLLSLIGLLLPRLEKEGRACIRPTSVMPCRSNDSRKSARGWTRS